MGAHHSVRGPRRGALHSGGSMRTRDGWPPTPPLEVVVTRSLAEAHGRMEPGASLVLTRGESRHPATVVGIVEAPNQVRGGRQGMRIVPDRGLILSPDQVAPSGEAAFVVRARGPARDHLGTIVDVLSEAAPGWTVGSPRVPADDIIAPTRSISRILSHRPRRGRLVDLGSDRGRGATGRRSGSPLEASPGPRHSLTPPDRGPRCAPSRRCERRTDGVGPPGRRGPG